MNRYRFLRFFLLSIFFWPYYVIRIKHRSVDSTLKNRFLIVPQNNRLGDLMCATPVLRAIRNKYPQCYIAVLVSESKGSWMILKNNPHIDEIIFYETPNLLKKIRAEKFSWSFHLTTYPIASVIAFLGLIPHRIKTVVRERSLSEILTDWLNTRKYIYEHHTSVPLHYLRLLEQINIHNPSTLKEVFVSQMGELKATEFLSNLEIQEDDFLIGMSITAGNKIKEWGDDRFVELAQRLIATFKAKIVLIGSPHDGTRLMQTRNSITGSDRVFIASNFSIEELPSILRRFKLYIAVDTGPIYVAHALRIPLIDISGPCDTREQPPSDELSLCITPDSIPPSSFVFKHPGSLLERRRAIEAISVDQVFSSIQIFIKRLGFREIKH
ncbi:MAG: glycosyltransferase family 9 protein [Patescibacteria group bacterium]